MLENLFQNYFGLITATATILRLWPHNVIGPWLCVIINRGKIRITTPWSGGCSGLIRPQPVVTDYIVLTQIIFLIFSFVDLDNTLKDYWLLELFNLKSWIMRWLEKLELKSMGCSLKSMEWNLDSNGTNTCRDKQSAF
jgi:hypothetical protein